MPVIDRRSVLAGLAAAWTPLGRAQAAEPIRIGCSMSMTGGVAPVGKQVLLALQIWRDEVNAKGGLLGRPVDLIAYDDQSSAANVPAIYTKLMDIDKVDLLIGPYATNMIAPAIPVLMQKNKMTIGILGNSANSEFHYPGYFSMNVTGPEPERSYSTGFFELAKAQSPAPRTVALIGADAEYGRNALSGAHKNVKEMGGLAIVYEQAYPPSTGDYTPILRAVQATNPDMVFVAAYPPDTVGVIRAAGEIGLTTKMFGGALVGLGVAAVRQQLGPLMNGMINGTVFAPSKTFLAYPGTSELVAHYQAAAKLQGIDPLGYVFPPFGYAAGQVLAEAVTATGTLDQEKLTQYIHGHTFSTVVGPVSFGKDGEWAQSRRIFTQFRHVVANDLDQFRSTAHEEIVWPAEFKTAEMIYPYAAAKT